MKKAVLILLLGLSLNMGLIAQKSVKYPIEAGTIEYTMSMMGVDNNIVMYFNEHGNVQCTDAKISMMGIEIYNRTLLKGNVAYILDMTEKTYTVTEFSEEDMKKQMNYLDDSNEDVLAEQGIKKEGEEEFLGKPCKIYSGTKDGADTKFWTWKGLLLKMEATTQGMLISMVANSIDESNPDPGLFEIPSDFTKKE